MHVYLLIKQWLFEQHNNGILLAIFLANKVFGHSLTIILLRISFINDHCAPSDKTNKLGSLNITQPPMRSSNTDFDLVQVELFIDIGWMIV